MNPTNVTENAEETVTNPFIGQVTSQPVNPFSGKKEKMTATYSLPMATSSADMSALSNGSEEDMLFWYNFGRKIAAARQVNSMLEFDLGSEELNNKYSAFENALKNMVDDSTPEPTRRKYIDFILSAEKFAPVKEALEKRDKEGTAEIVVDFAEVELRKPSGKRGRRKKEDGSSDESSE